MQGGDADQKNLVTIILICCPIVAVGAVVVSGCCFRRVPIEKDPSNSSGTVTMKSTVGVSLFQNEGTCSLGNFFIDGRIRVV
jgi:hypothetical protein